VSINTLRKPGGTPMRIDAIENVTKSKDLLPIGREVSTAIRKTSGSVYAGPGRIFMIRNPSTNETATIGEMELIKAIENASKNLEPESISLQYSRHEQTGIMMLKIVNRDTQEIIREIPPEKVLDVIGAIWEMAGIIVDKKV
jgi:flagellar protein FlaG